MNISKISSPAFNGTLKIMAREQDSLEETLYSINTTRIKNIKNRDSYTLIKNLEGDTLFVSAKTATYKQIMTAYNAVKDNNMIIFVKK